MVEDTRGNAPVVERAPQRRRIERRRPLPGTRPVVGALLMAVAALGVFLAYTDAARGPEGSRVVASVDLRPGDVVAPDDVELVAVDLPESVADRAFTDPEQVVGRVLVGPVAQGELLQAALLSVDRPVELAHEIALVLPRAHAATARLQPGDRVDVFATVGDRTERVVGGALLVGAGGLRGGAIGEEREVEVVIAVPSQEIVTEVVHALRTADVTIVRSTLAETTGS